MSWPKEQLSDPQSCKSVLSVLKTCCGLCLTGEKASPPYRTQKQHCLHPHVSQCHTESLMRTTPSVSACSHSLHRLNPKSVQPAEGTSLRGYHLPHISFPPGRGCPPLSFSNNKAKQTLWQACPTSSTDKPGPV